MLRVSQQRNRNDCLMFPLEKCESNSRDTCMKTGERTRRLITAVPADRHYAWTSIFTSTQTSQVTR